MKDSILVPIEIIEDLRGALQASYTYLDAQDLMESQRRMREKTYNSDITLEVKHALDGIEDLYARHLLAERDQRRASRAAYEEKTPEVEEPIEGWMACDPGDHELDEDGYCVICGMNEDEIESQSLGSASDDSENE